ncbi:MAG TPA: GNAT family N-acetyltransferase [Bryobacteraceae bacterium]
MRGRVIPASELSLEEIAAWDGLCRNHPSLASPFLTPHYTRALASVAPHVFVCVLMRGADRVGFLPFQFRSRFHRLLRTAGPPGLEMTDYFGLVAEPGIGIDEPKLLKLASLHVLTFSHLDETQLEYGLSGEAPETGYLLHLDPEESNWQALRRAHRKFARHTEQGERQATRDLGPLRFTPMEPDWKAGLANLVTFKGRQYRETGQSNLFAIPWKRQLLEKLAACREATCTGILSTLYAGDTWLASHFGMRGGGILHYWFPVYNPEWSRFGPGRLLFKALIDNAHEMKLTLIDHGAGEALYKRECSNGSHKYYRGEWRRAGVGAWFGRAAESARWRMERLAGNVAVNTRGKTKTVATVSTEDGT